MTTDVQQGVAASQAGMLQLELTLVTLRHLVPLAEMRPLLHEHHDYVEALERDGHLFGSGPILDEDGDAVGTSMWIVRADPVAAAALAAADPLCRAGMRSVETARWRLNMGSLNVRVKMSDGTVEVG
ncbi:MAG TPA: YciI family protein [Conexibacter sp.]|nr:YciI family protein [Conexibacter sp.]